MLVTCFPRQSHMCITFSLFCNFYHTFIKKQNTEICTLKARLDKLEKPKKDSHNSNTPPSKEDIAASEERKRTKSLREPSGKKSGEYSF